MLPEPYEAERYQAAPARERVMVFPSSLLDKCGRFQGIRTKWKRLARTLLAPENLKYIDRLEAEQQEELKQVVSYVLVTRRNRILAFRRGTFNRVEDFLRGANCIGFGGHVSEVDRTLYNMSEGARIVQDSAVRELLEELSLPDIDQQRLRNGTGLRVVGLLNDDSSGTGRRHFAVVLHYSASDDQSWDDPGRGEKSITQLRWMNLDQPDVQLKDFEYWSQLCMTEFYPAAVHAQPSFLVRRKKPLRPPNLLCILGGIGSGKSSATEILKREFGYAEVNSGHVLADLLGIPPVPVTPREEFQSLAWEFINSETGPAELAKAIYERALLLGSERVLIDGVRQRATLDALRGVSQRSVGVMFVYAPPNVTFNFYSQREGAGVDIHAFLRVTGAEVESEVRRLISQSDAVIYNWAGKSMYKDAIRKLMNHVGVERSRR
jgi:predicted NUDIX family phosphoesterase